MESKRRTNLVGDPMLIDLPLIDDPEYEDTKEGGLAFFLGVKSKLIYEEKRNITCEGDIRWLCPDVCFTQGWKTTMSPDAILLIGSTGRSLYNKKKETYFKAGVKDLTQEGMNLYILMKKIYGQVEIITLLDT